MAESEKKKIPELLETDINISIKKFAEYIGRSEARVRTVMAAETAPKPIKCGYHVAGGREASLYSLNELLEFYKKSLKARKPRTTKIKYELNTARLW